MNGQPCFVPRMTRRAGRGTRRDSRDGRTGGPGRHLRDRQRQGQLRFDDLVRHAVADVGDELRHRRQRQRRLRADDRRVGRAGQRPGLQGATSNPDFNYLQSDNGNLNYKKNQLISSALKGNHELVLQFRDGWSALGRFSWLYDPATDNTERTPLTDDAKNIAVTNITLLDVWVAKDFDLAKPAGQGEGRQPGAELGRGHLHLRRHQHHQPDRPHARAQAGRAAEGDLPAGADGVVQLRREQQPVHRGLLAVPLERVPLRPGGNAVLHG